MTEDVSTKIDSFFSDYRLRKYAKGQVLILNGDDAIFVYQLVSGKVKEYEVTYRGDEIILNVFKPPAFFPMSLAINKTVNQYIYEAESAIEVRQAPAEAVVEFIKANPDVLFDLLSRVYRGIDGLLGRIVHLMSGSAQSRLLYELVLEYRRFGTTSEDGSCQIKLNESDLAARAGLSRETVSREMKKLNQVGLLEITRSTIVIPNLARLENKLVGEL